MDLSNIDRLVEVLQKAAARTATRPGSAAVTIDGQRGIWRTVRGFRVFLELKDGELGRVLIGPPSFQGKSLDDVDSKVWAEITPSATKRKFSNVDVAKDGIENLKSAIKQSIGPDDTRNEHLPTVKTVEQIVPLARSAGFTDDEIASALKGKSVGEAGKKVPSLPDRLTRSKIQVGSSEDSPSVEREPAKTKPDEAFQGIIDAFNSPAKREDREKIIAESILRRAENESDAKIRLRLLAIGHGLNSGNLSVSEARSKVQDVMDNQTAGTPTPSKKEVDVLHDRVELKQFLNGYEKRIEDMFDSKLRQAAGDSERAKELAMVDMIRQLENKVYVKEVKTELLQIREDLEGRKVSRTVTVSRLIALLRQIMALIPG